MAPSEKVAALRALRVPGLPRFRLADAADASAKDVYFIRHGEAAHNVAPRPWGEELVDAPLTDVGRQQAAGLVPQAAGVTLDVVIVSPLVRAIETATIGLAAHLERGVPFVVEELCREQLGPNLPDKRRPKDALAAAHPALDFSAMPDCEDTLFMTEQPSKVERVRPGGVDRPTRPSRLPPARAAPGQAQGRPPASASRLCLPPPAPSLLTLPPRPPAAANRQMCSGWPSTPTPVCLPGVSPSSLVLLTQARGAAAHLDARGRLPAMAARSARAAHRRGHALELPRRPPERRARQPRAARGGRVVWQRGDAARAPGERESLSFAEGGLKVRV